MRNLAGATGLELWVGDATCNQQRPEKYSRGDKLKLQAKSRGICAGIRISQPSD